ncbi:MAG: heavy metal-binding domain-containing protein [Synergistaceae bacterium]|nr:heavy metal-binding domain-containing protein [Synergistaceae bacterium]
MNGITLSTGAFPPSGTQELGIIYGVSCLSSNFFRDTKETIKNVTVGGELRSYTAMIQKGIKLAEERLKEEAATLGADGVFGVKIASPQVSAGAAEIIVYGTAYRYVLPAPGPSPQVHGAQVPQRQD